MPPARNVDSQSTWRARRAIIRFIPPRSLRHLGAGFGPQHMLCRVDEPTGVASVILFLCGPGASFITGTDVVVDGGYVASS